MENVFIMDHPLIQHKISMLRNKNTGTNEFRKLIEEIAVLMGYEALRDLPLEEVEVETPIETCMTPMISGKKLAVVPVLRAGLGMVNGITTLVPSAKIGHIGLYRDPETHEPHEYYCKLPDPIEQRLIVVAGQSCGLVLLDKRTLATTLTAGADLHHKRYIVAARPHAGGQRLHIAVLGKFDPAVGRMVFQCHSRRNDTCPKGR